MRGLALFVALGMVGCTSTWDAFRIENGDACTTHPLDCGSGKVCSYQTRQCQPQSCRQSGLCWESPRPQLFQPRAVWGQSGSELWMVGSHDIYRANGSTVTPVLTDLPVRLRAIVGFASDNVFFFGEQGTILNANFGLRIDSYLWDESDRFGGGRSAT